MRYVANVALFQAAWLACVLGAANGWPWAGIAVALAAIGISVMASGKPRTVMALVLVSGIIGLCVEVLLIGTGVARYASGGPLSWAPPAWLLTIWLAFGTLPAVSLSWLERRPILAAVLGAIGGPVAYAGGAALGGMMISPPDLGLVAIAAAWAVATPLLMLVARRVDCTAAPV